MPLPPEMRYDTCQIVRELQDLMISMAGRLAIAALLSVDERERRSLERLVNRVVRGIQQLGSTQNDDEIDQLIDSYGPLRDTCAVALASSAWEGEVATYVIEVPPPPVSQTLTRGES